MRALIFMATFLPLISQAASSKSLDTCFEYGSIGFHGPRGYVQLLAIDEDGKRSGVDEKLFKEKGESKVGYYDGIYHELPETNIDIAEHTIQLAFHFYSKKESKIRLEVYLTKDLNSKKKEFVEVVVSVFGKKGDWSSRKATSKEIPLSGKKGEVKRFDISFNHCTSDQDKMIGEVKEIR